MDELHAIIGSGPENITWWQLSIRAVLVFLWLVVLFRLMPRKAFSSASALDIGVVVLAGSSLSRALTSNAPFVPTLAGTAALVIAYALASAAARRSETLSRLLKGRRMEVVKDGRIDEGALSRAQLGLRDLEEQLRMKGVQDVGEVALAYIERNGQISVFQNRPQGEPPRPRASG